MPAFNRTASDSITTVDFAYIPTRTVHSRLDDHTGIDLDSNIQIDGAVGTNVDGTNLHDVLLNLVSGGAGTAEFITGDSSEFTTSLGSWTNSGGTLSRETSVKIAGLNASLKWITAATNNYIEVPLSGTFVANTWYQALLFLYATTATGTVGAALTMGLHGTDTASVTVGSAYYLGNWTGTLVRWSPTADRTGVTVRLTRTSAETDARVWHVGFARAINLSGKRSAGLELTPHPGGDANKLLVSGASPDYVYISAHEDNLGLANTYLAIGNNDINLKSGWGGVDGVAGVWVGPESAALWAQHTPGDFYDGGVRLSTGDNDLGFYISEKDTSTIQLYPDVNNGHNIELTDRGTAVWKTRSGTSVFSLQNVAKAPTTINFIIDGGGSAITSGVKGDLELPFSGTITANRVFADQTGSIVIDLWKDTYANFPPVVGDSITASAKPTLSSAIKSENSTLTGWTKTFSAGDVLRVNVDSATTVTRVTLSLSVVRT